MAGPITLAGTFDWCQVAGWETCSQIAGCCVSSYEMEDRVFVRIESTLHVPLQRAKELVRPEAYADQAAAVAYGYDRTAILREYTPGDALVEYEWGLGTKCPLLFCVLVGRKLKSALATQSEQGKKTDRVVVRHSLRSDFPQQGCLAWVVIPVKDNRLVDQVGLSPPATANWIEADGDEVRQVRIFNLPSTTFHIVKHLLGHFCTSVCNRSFETAALQTSGGACAFQLVHLKRCGSQPPLLPLDVHTWHHPTWDEFNLATWIEQFARFAGCLVEAHASFDGRLLPKRCAAVRRDQWAYAWPKFEALFKVQRQAYRKQYGGKDAPVLALADRPHWPAQLAPDPGQEHSDAVESSVVVVKNTFLHVARDDDDDARSNVSA